MFDARGEMVNLTNGAPVWRGLVVNGMRFSPLRNRHETMCPLGPLCPFVPVALWTGTFLMNKLWTGSQHNKHSLKNVLAMRSALGQVGHFLPSLFTKSSKSSSPKGTLYFSGAKSALIALVNSPSLEFPWSSLVIIYTFNCLLFLFVIVRVKNRCNRIDSPFQ